MSSTFGERLYELRHQKHLSQKQIADELDMTVSALSQYENGKRTPKQEILTQLALYFNVSVDYLLGLSDTPVKSYDYSSGNKQVPVLSSSDEISYGQRNGDVAGVIDVSAAKARILTSINSLSREKQMEVLAIIELILGTISNN